MSKFWKTLLPMNPTHAATRPPAAPGPRSAWFLTLCLLFALLPRATPAQQPRPIRFAFSKVLFLGVNENDARAAIKIYAEAIAEDSGLVTEGGPALLDGPEAIATALDRGDFDLVSLATPDFFALESRGLVGPILLTRVGSSFTEELVLLVHQRTERREFADLATASLLVQRDTRSVLADPWLELRCREAGLPPPPRAFAKLAYTARPLHAILPVFFGKTDACLVTRSSWDVMGELNPQVKSQLRVVASSPPFVPVLTCFHRHVPDDIKERILHTAVRSAEKPAFQQLMALFKTENLLRQPVSALEDTRRFVAEHRRLVLSSGAAETPGGK